MKLHVLTAIALACAAFPALAERYIVEFRPRSGVAASSIDTLQRFRADLARLDASAATDLRASSSATVRRGFDVLFDGASIDLDRASAIRAILALPYVANVHLDREVTAGPVIEATSAAAAAGVATHAGGSGVVVAVIDSGIDYNHPALGGGFGPGRKVRGGYDFVNDDADPMDDNRHGTHVAGIIAAKSAELTGIAPEVSLLAYKVLDAKGKGSQSHVIAALERAVDPDGNGDFSDRARVINLSLGSVGHPDDPVSKAVDRASALGVVVVVSVGNSGEEHSIASPALARTALAVGAVDGGREVAEFSARGPAVQSSAPRPDVLAPGVLIRSAAIGGGTLTLSGTSMAAPYVAGLAARLIEAHPAWSSERVRSAIIYSSYPVPGAPVMAQGAGVVDIPTALSSSVFIEPGPLGFGVLDRRTATWRATRTIRLRSDLDVPVTLRAEAGALPDGVNITATPAEIELRPGVETIVTIDLEADVAKVDAGQQGLAFGGWLKLVRGAVDAYVPWAVVRAGRVRTTSPHEFPQLVWSTSGVARGSIASLDPYTHEALLEPATYDLAMVADADGETSVFVRERLVVDGDLQLDFTAADAPHAVRWEGNGPAGAPLSAGASESRLYSVAGRLLFADGARKWSIELPASMKALWSSSFGTRWSLLLTESVVDVSRNEIVVAQHQPVVALAAAALLRTSSSDYKSQLVEAVFPRDAAERNIYLTPRWLTRRAIESGRRPAGIGVANVGSTWSGTAWMTPEVHPDYASGVQIGLYTGDAAMLETSSIVTPMIRRRGERFVNSWSIDPVPLPIESPVGGLLSWGAGAVWPSTNLVLSPTEGGTFAWGGTIEILGDRNDRRRRETAKAAWRLVGADGSAVTGGSIGLGGFATPATASRRLEVLVASPETERFAASTGLLEVEMAANLSEDVTPPTLTSFAIVDAAGQQNRGVRRGSSSRIVFSAADYTLTPDQRVYGSIDASAAKVLVRRHGTETWQALAMSRGREDAGTEEELGRPAAGHVFEVPLSGLGDAGMFDVRIELADRSGHRVRWTLSPAFRLDDGSRRRSARH